jgi:hypothetical protein
MKNDGYNLIAVGIETNIFAMRAKEIIEDIKF